MSIIRLILGDQLNQSHSWFATTDDGVLYTLMEIRGESEYVTHHVQKIAAIFLAMRRFAAWLRDSGHRVEYVSIDDADNAHSFGRNLARLVEENGADRIEYIAPDEHRLDVGLAEQMSGLGVEHRAVDSEHFLTTRDEVARQFEGRKRFLMESFYRRMRKEHDVLMDDGEPAGGKWNFDADNRNRYDGAVPLPDPISPVNDASDVVAAIRASDLPTLGSVEPKRLEWPVDREQALEVLDRFVSERLPHFGTYQDSMTGESIDLFHSRLSFALNVKLIGPMEVIRAAEAAWRSDPERCGIAQVEGFVRQVLGWREYVRGIYWALMPEYAERNAFECERPLPRYYWDGDTRMSCMRHTIRQSLEHAYAHHIQRLMITGNFALIAGVAPDEVDAWYLGIYADAFEWVELPNTRGMSQFADGGVMATKPYAASANYINKMSDYCAGCHYDRKDKTGENACPFNTLYWHFLHRNRERLETNPRMGMVYRVWERMNEDTRRATIAAADRHLDELDSL